MPCPKFPKRPYLYLRNMHNAYYVVSCMLLPTGDQTKYELLLSDCYECTRVICYETSLAGSMVNTPQLIDFVIKDTA